uniref:Uncharacterized protein n=1 Tax=Haptolina brevifila TaxID=156173 RepID=A0A7S2CKG8_9EUKA|mmetsp:Transcript_25730/g.51660  ORF Transcript_25730/g.51660 Transcript_25730/m.51660 type:complete len:286 (+) Transcript_25730:41-898(+)
MALALLFATASAFAPLSGVTLPKVSTGETVNLGDALSTTGTTLLVLGTYPADFNMIEYAQKLRHYLPALQDKGVERVLCTVNGKQSSCELLAELVGIPETVELLSDEEGVAGRAFGVGRGWLADEDEIDLFGRITVPMSPYAKLLGMLVGLGAGNTLPSVIAGYVGNPSGVHGWIESALAQGQSKGRWPDMALDVGAAGDVERNSFDELPLVGGWGRRPLELATLRLQTMLGISLAKWDELQPVDDRCLTQLGGLVAVRDGSVVYEWKDNGICAVAHFEDLLKAL